MSTKEEIVNMALAETGGPLEVELEKADAENELLRAALHIIASGEADSPLRTLSCEEMSRIARDALAAPNDTAPVTSNDP